MGRLDGRVAIVTGAGRGLGRAHALQLAELGAAVVVNDLGASLKGEGADMSPAQEVVQEIERNGGHAIVSGHDVASWDGAAALVALAVEAFGHLDVLVNNAGILRDRTFANMEEAEWDAVIRVLLKGHAAPTRHALAYWRDRAQAGEDLRPSVIHTSSAAGLAGNFGQANYSAAKIAVLALSRVVSIEGRKYGVRSNVVSPSARTRLTLASGKSRHDSGGPTVDATGWDPREPGNVSPVVAWLAQRDCPADSQIFHVTANRVHIVSMPRIVDTVTTSGRWTLDALDRALASRLVTQTAVEDYHKETAAQAV